MTHIEPNNNYKELLLGNWLISQLSHTELTTIERSSTIVSYRKRETIVKKGEFATHVVMLLTGFVKMEIEQGRRTFILDIIPQGNIIGLPIALSNDKQVFSIVPLTDATIQFIPIETLKRTFENNGRIAVAAMQYANSSFVLPMLDKLQTISQNNIRGRLAKLLLYLSVKTHCSNSFTLLLTRHELAQMIGFSRENVIRILSEFHSEGVVSIKGKHIEINNTTHLNELAKYS